MNALKIYLSEFNHHEGCLSLRTADNHNIKVIEPVYPLHYTPLHAVEYSLSGNSLPERFHEHPEHPFTSVRPGD